MTAKLISLLLLVSVCSPATTARAWGAKGHEVVVRLALRKMKPAERNRVCALLGTTDAHAIGHWADSIRSLRPNTEPWHFVDIPADSAGYKPARDCSSTCIFEQLQVAEATVRDHSATKDARREALLFWF